MARTALGLGVRDLAAAAGVSTDTVARFERGDALKERTISALQAALEAAGVIFIEQNGEGPGVRLRKQAVSKLDTAFEDGVKGGTASGLDAAFSKKETKGYLK